MSNENVKKAKELAEELTVLGREKGAQAIIVMIGTEDGSHYVAYTSEPRNGFAIRGLLEICVDRIRNLMRSSFAVPKFPAITMTGGGGAGGSSRAKTDEP